MMTVRHFGGSRRVSALAAAIGLTVASSATAQDFEELRAARAAVAANARDADAQYRLGQALIEAQDLGGARAAFEAAVRARAGWTEALWGAARTRMAEGNYDESRNACRRLIQAAGADAAIGHVCMGQAYLVWRRSSLAVEEFDKAIVAEAGNAAAHAGLGDAHARANEIDRAIAEYRRAVELDGSLVEARIGLAVMLERNGDKPGAVEQLRAAVSARAWSAEARYHLGRLVESDAEALEHLALAVAIRPPYTDAQIEYGRRLSSAGRWADAVAPLRTAVQQRSNVGTIHELLGIALWKTGQLAEAETSLRTAVQGVPNSPRGNEALGEVIVALGRVEEGLAFLETAANLDSRNFEIPLRIAGILHDNGRDTLATGFLDRALRIRPDLSRANALYADILFGQGRYAESRGYYEKALAGDGAGIDAARIRTQLGQLEGLIPRTPPR
jgi:tetratricopeptide (TPR) repeat protein